MRFLVRLGVGWAIGLAVGLVIASMVPHGFLFGVVIGWACTMIGVLVAGLTDSAR